jgi:hypothetical protein
MANRKTYRPPVPFADLAAMISALRSDKALTRNERERMAAAFDRILGAFSVQMLDDYYEHKRGAPAGNAPRWHQAALALFLAKERGLKLARAIAVLTPTATATERKTIERTCRALRAPGNQRRPILNQQEKEAALNACRRTCIARASPDVAWLLAGTRSGRK